METRVAAVAAGGGDGLGRFGPGSGLARLEEWRIGPEAGEAVAALEPAARLLRAGSSPVAFPTETVYGLGADATRSAAVRGIYAAKGRPSDNPLIVHVCDLQMLRRLLAPPPSSSPSGAEQHDGGDLEDRDDDDDKTLPLLPAIYRPLIERFWPGPLTILLRNPTPSRLAPEVTAGLATFGVRMPSSPLALTLIKLAGVPLAAPSANASTRPSPTTAQHVRDDLDGRIELILDGGPCRVGLESTVVDGLCDPPAVLRPGGVGLDELRACPGWEAVVRAYKDRSEEGKAAPRAPGMKYKHYSPRARVVLYEASRHEAADGILPSDVEGARAVAANGDPSRANGHGRRSLGIIRTKRWKPGAGLNCDNLRPAPPWRGTDDQGGHLERLPETACEVLVGDLRDRDGEVIAQVYDLGLGTDTRAIAQGLFSALRELDRRGADTIFVDGIDGELDMAAAVMNRLRKAASETRA